MKFGVIPPYGAAPVESPEFAVAFARLAEEHGFESLWAEALGTCFDNRGRRADEYIEIMRTLWREPVASFLRRRFEQFCNDVMGRL